jgi:hypothetical protein
VINIDEYLVMSRNNPKFKKDFDYIIHSIHQARNNEEITQDQYLEYHNKLYGKKDGEFRESVNKAFARIHTIRRDGFTNLDFSSEQMKFILLARNTATEFYRWVDLKRHKPNNSYIIDYMKKTAMELIPLLQANDERLWDVYVELRNAALMAVTRGIVSRVYMDDIAKVIYHAMVHEYNVRKSLEKHNVKHLNLFEGEIADIDIDIEELGPTFVFKFLTNYNEFEAMSKDMHDKLEDLLNSGKIDRVVYGKHNATLNNYTYYVMEMAEVRSFDPIIVYHWCKEKKTGFEPCYVYTEQQMVKAVEFARDFHKIFTNEFIEVEMVLRKLNVDLKKYDNSTEVKLNFYSSLMESLDILREYDIIPLTKYLEYAEKGREKFL